MYYAGSISRAQLRDALRFYKFKVPTRRKRGKDGVLIDQPAEGSDSESDGSEAEASDSAQSANEVSYY